MNITANEPSSWSCYSLVNPVVEKLVQTVAFSLILVVSSTGNSLIAIIVFKTPSLRKPINFMIANMAMSNLLFPIFLFPLNLVEMQADTWHISDPLYLTLCKIGFFLSTISGAMSIQSLIMITVDRFEVVVVPIRSPLISKKHCPFSIIASWIVAVAAYSHICFLSNLLNTLDGWQGARDKYHLRTFTNT